MNKDEAGVENEIKGGWYANIAMILCLAFGLLLTVFIKEDLKRQNVESQKSQKTSPRKSHSETSFSHKATEEYENLLNSQI